VKVQLKVKLVTPY